MGEDMNLFMYAMAKKAGGSSSQAPSNEIDLSDYAKKSELENLATKSELENLATKDDVARVRTYKAFPDTWNAKATNAYTTKQLCDVINADPNAVEGTVFLGESRCKDLHSLPGGVNLTNGELVVEIIKGTGTSGKVIHINLSSGNRVPFRWEYTYWNNGNAVSGWQGLFPIKDGGITKDDLASNVLSYQNLSGKPTIPTDFNDLSDNLGIFSGLEGRVAALEAKLE